MEILLGVDQAGGEVRVDLDTHTFGLIVGGTADGSTESAAYALALSAAAGAAAPGGELEIWRISPQEKLRFGDLISEISRRERLLHDAEQTDFISYNNWCRDRGVEPLPPLLIQVEGFPDLLDGYRPASGGELARAIASSRSLGFRIQLFSGFLPYRQTPSFLHQMSYLVMLHTDVHTSLRLLGDKSAAELNQPAAGLVVLNGGKPTPVRIPAATPPAN